ncbi:dual specificity protein phosphatase family protein [Bernardetia sp. Wsw4-3y2]|uniref:protein-tyrosine phosphatase family protein n=1 Tax=Bernardetia sp. Wsw4-3y2 TaxID=3127471 RepID=UPI0030D3EFC7
MKTRIFWITKNLAIMPKPNSDNFLEEDIIHFSNQKLNILVSLLTREESFDLGLQNEKSICEKYAIDFISLPIIDRSVPTEKQTAQIRELAKKLVERINNILDKNEKIIIHCRAGIGRAGMLCSAILIEQGVSNLKAIEKISDARGLRIPDTEEQKNWIMKY